jgi:hypothetical protein
VNLRKNEQGQAVVLIVLALTAVLGMCALVLDVGSWYRTKRQLQATADAAALAGAQKLPGDATGARSLAASYADKNGGNVLASDIIITSTYGPDDTLAVKGDKTEQGVFSKVLGIGSARIDARAKVRVDQPVRARYVAPIVVRDTQEFIYGTGGCPCFGRETTIDLARNGAPGAFNLLNLDGSRGGISPGTLASWMLDGYDGYLSLGEYYSDPGAKFNASQMQAALEARKNTVLLFPVYDTLTGSGANAKYNVIGWIGFMMTDWSARGSSGTLTGYFTEYIAQGILNESGPSGQPNFGVRTIQLIE